MPEMDELDRSTTTAAFIVLSYHVLYYFLISCQSYSSCLLMLKDLNKLCQSIPGLLIWDLAYFNTGSSIPSSFNTSLSNWVCLSAANEEMLAGSRSQLKDVYESCFNGHTKKWYGKILPCYKLVSKKFGSKIIVDYKNWSSQLQSHKTTVNIRNPDCPVLLDSILCQSRTFGYRTIQKPDKDVRFSNGYYRPFWHE